MLDWIQTINQTLPYFLPICVFIFGAICGSFLNVCIYRIPMGRSIIWPPSSCHCGKRIAPVHNIPIVSWLFLRGKAVCCDDTFSVRYLIVELITGIAFLLVWLKHEPLPLVALIGMLFFGILIAATFIDLDHMIIPDCFSIGGALMGLAVSALVPELHGYSAESLSGHLDAWITSILGLCVGTAIVYWISVIAELILKKPAMGEGDVKFLAAIGAFTGWQGALFSLFGGAFLGTIIILPYLLFQHLKNPTEPKLQELPFGPFLALGAIVYFLWLSDFIDAYFAQIVNVFTL